MTCFVHPTTSRSHSERVTFSTWRKPSLWCNTQAWKQAVGVKSSRFPSLRGLNHDNKTKQQTAIASLHCQGVGDCDLLPFDCVKKKSRGWTSKTTVTSGHNRTWGEYNHWSTSLPLMPCYLRTWYIYHSGRLKRLTLSLLLFSPYYLYVHMPSSGALL